MFKNFRKRWAKEPEFKPTATDKPEPNPNCEVLRVLRFKNNLYVVGDMVTVIYRDDTGDLTNIDGKITRISENTWGYPSYIYLDVSTRFHSKTIGIDADRIDTIALWEDEDAETR